MAAEPLQCVPGNGSRKGSTIRTLVAWVPAAVSVYTCVFVLEQVFLATGVLSFSRTALVKMFGGALVLVAFALKSYFGSMNWSLVARGAFLVWGLYAWAFASVLWSIDPRVTAAHGADVLPYVFVSVVVGPFLVSNFTEFRVYRRTLLAVGGLALLAAFIGMDWGNRGIIVRGFASVFQRDELPPLAIATLSGYLFVFLTVGRETGERFLRSSAAWLCAFGLLYLSLRTGSRGQVISMVVSAVVLEVVLHRGQLRVQAGRLIALGVIVLVGGLAIVGTPTVYRWNLAVMERNVEEGRVEPTVVLFDHWMNSSPEHVLLGLGNSASYSTLTGGISKYPHFVPGEVLAEEGLIGATLLAMCLAAGLVYPCVVLWRREFRWEERRLLAQATAVGLFLFNLSLKSGSLMGHYQTFLVIAITSVLAYQCVAGKKTWTEPRSRGAAESVGSVQH